MTEIQLLEGVQRTFTRSIGGLENINYWERLSCLKMMSLQRRRERYIILMMWKFTETSRHGTRAIIPSLSRSSSSSNQTLYDSSFAVRGPRLWNIVPENVKAAVSFESFKNSLSDFFALIPDEPPVAGYRSSWSNSLVDYSPIRWSEI